MTKRDGQDRGDVGLAVLEEGEGSRWGKAHHILLAFLGLALLMWLGSGFYKVNVDEVAIVERLGKFISTGEEGKAALVEQGLHYRMPWPIDRVYKIPVQQTRTLIVDEFYTPSDAYADFKRQAMRESDRNTPELLSALFDPYLVTADKNVIHMSIAVTYRIDDPEAWISTVSHETETTPLQAGQVSGNGNADDTRQQLFQEIVKHAMVRSLAKIPVDRVLFEGSDQMQFILTNAVQEAMKLPDPSDAAGKRLIDLGVDVQTVSVVATHWPQYQTVDDAFQSVLKAKSEADSARNVAQSYADTARTKARSEQNTMVQEAQAYAKQMVDSATGEANRFTQVFEQYQKAPDVTRWNVYAEAVKSVSGNATRIVFGEPGQKTILTLDPPQFDAAQNGAQK